MELGAKIYYEKLTGNVILIRGDMQGFVTETSFLEDYEMYSDLKKYEIGKIGVIQLEYGELSRLMEENKANSVRVDISSDRPTLVFSYVDYNTGEPTKPPRTIEDYIEDLKKENEKLKEETENVKLENATAMAEIIEKSEKDKIELSQAIAEVIEMASNK